MNSLQLLMALTPTIIEARKSGWDFSMHQTGEKLLSVTFVMPEPRRPTVAEIAQTLGVSIEMARQ